MKHTYTTARDILIQWWTLHKFSIILSTVWWWWSMS